MSNQRTCPSCGGAKVARTTTRIDRRTGKSVKGLHLTGGIALSALGIIPLWLGISLMTTPLPKGTADPPLVYLVLAVSLLAGGIAMIVTFLRADRVKRFN